MLQAKFEYENARTKWAKHLAESQFTADGHSFVFGCLSDYWVIRNYVSSTPRMDRVSLWPREIASFDDNGSVSVFIVINDRNIDTRVHRHETVVQAIEISQLYRNHEAACKALAVALRERSEELLGQADSYEQR